RGALQIAWVQSDSGAERNSGNREHVRRREGEDVLRAGGERRASGRRMELGIVYEFCAAIVCAPRSEEHTSELQSRFDLVCRLLLEKKKHPYRATVVGAGASEQYVRAA